MYNNKLEYISAINHIRFGEIKFVQLDWWETQFNSTDPQTELADYRCGGDNHPPLGNC